MIETYIRRLINRWLYSIARELLKEAQESQRNGDLIESKIFVGLGAALNRADGKMP